LSDSVAVSVTVDSGVAVLSITFCCCYCDAGFINEY